LLGEAFFAGILFSGISDRATIPFNQTLLLLCMIELLLGGLCTPIYFAGKQMMKDSLRKDFYKWSYEHSQETTLDQE
jgi:hypothetical protein